MLVFASWARQYLILVYSYQEYIAKPDRDDDNCKTKLRVFYMTSLT